MALLASSRAGSLPHLKSIPLWGELAREGRTTDPGESHAQKMYGQPISCNLMGCFR
ncbi:hypothetical protein PputUW4_05206 [Pseudomonas sp. UW4]|nr:hypothetical protein PputUW4_05206 [Pseudomonas sp. UW4]